MDMHSREQYLASVRQEYRSAKSRKQKTRLLNEARKRTKLNRKVLIRKLAHPPTAATPRRRSRRKSVYDSAVVTTLIAIWEIFDFACGQRLQPVLKVELARLRQLGEVKCSDEVADKLGAISPKTIDRLLVPEKRARHLRRHRNPPVHPLLYQRIRVKTAGDWDRGQVGNVQLDYVMHGGRSTAGEYLHTLSGADIASGWWEGQAIAGRSQERTKEGLDQIRQRLPFRILEIHPDNDSGMINDLLWRYCQKAKIRMSRSRPYQKNDNAWVEQRNWTHVRKVVGYSRFDNMKQLAILNELYRYLGLYKNFCQPTMKLQEKVRAGGKMRRIYDEPQTPYQRLLDNGGGLSKRQHGELRATYESLNPAELKRRIESLRMQLFATLEANEGRRMPQPRGGMAPQLATRRRVWRTA
jgi:hypothetical protein